MDSLRACFPWPHWLKWMAQTDHSHYPFYHLSYQPVTTQPLPIPQAVSMSMFIVFLCCGLCYGYGSVETRAAVPPGRSGDAVDTPFHRGRLLYKREPRPSASSSKAITTFIADFTNLLLKDLTEMIKTRMSLFPPKNVKWKEKGYGDFSLYVL